MVSGSSFLLARPLGAKEQRDGSPKHQLSEELWSGIKVRAFGDTHPWDPPPVVFIPLVLDMEDPEARGSSGPSSQDPWLVHWRAMGAEGLLTAMRCLPSWPNAYLTHPSILSLSLSETGWVGPGPQGTLTSPNRAPNLTVKELLWSWA